MKIIFNRQETDVGWCHAVFEQQTVLPSHGTNRNSHVCILGFVFLVFGQSAIDLKVAATQRANSLTTIINMEELFLSEDLFYFVLFYASMK